MGKMHTDGILQRTVMSFPLRRDVGVDVLAAFASIALAHPDAPLLPPAMPDDSDEWLLDYEECDMSEPWSHDWGAWLAASFTTAYIGSGQGASMAHTPIQPAGSHRRRHRRVLRRLHKVRIRSSPMVAVGGRVNRAR